MQVSLQAIKKNYSENSTYHAHQTGCIDLRSHFIRCLQVPSSFFIHTKSPYQPKPSQCTGVWIQQHKQAVLIMLSPKHLAHQPVTPTFCVPALCLEHSYPCFAVQSSPHSWCEGSEISPPEAFPHFLRGNGTLDAHGFTCLGKICGRHRHLCACFICAIHTNVMNRANNISCMRINKITYFLKSNPHHQSDSCYLTF